MADHTITQNTTQQVYKIPQSRGADKLSIHLDWDANSAGTGNAELLEGNIDDPDKAVVSKDETGTDITFAIPTADAQVKWNIYSAGISKFYWVRVPATATAGVLDIWIN